VSFHASKGSAGHLSVASPLFILCVICIGFLALAISPNLLHGSFTQELLHPSPYFRTEVDDISGVKRWSSRLHHHLFDITPQPIFSWLEGLNNRVVGRMEMFGSVFILR